MGGGGGRAQSGSERREEEREGKEWEGEEGGQGVGGGRGRVGGDMSNSYHTTAEFGSQHMYSEGVQCGGGEWCLADLNSL